MYLLFLVLFSALIECIEHEKVDGISKEGKTISTFFSNGPSYESVTLQAGQIHCPCPSLIPCTTSITSSNNKHTLTCNQNTYSIPCGGPLQGTKTGLLSFELFSHPLCSTTVYPTILTDIVWKCSSLNISTASACEGDTTSPSATTAVGILIAGGNGAFTYAEIFLPGSGKSCALADLPDQRSGHTLDTVSNTAVLCGGYSTETSCLQFSQDTGTWSSYATTLESRYRHSSWVTAEETLVLMGGYGSPTTTEIVNSGRNFTLLQETRRACSIQLGSFTIITGGEDTLTAVSKYNLQGHVEDLPSLLEGRRYHACGSFQDGGNTVLVVAGGAGSERLGSTERLILGVDSAWTYGQALPRRLWGMASVSIDQAVIILGGWGGSTLQGRAEILSYNGVRDEWTQIGQMGIARYWAAATKIFVDPAVCG